MAQFNPAIASSLSDRTTFTNPKLSLTQIQRRIVADVLTWDAQRKVDPDEVELIAVTRNILWVHLTDHRAIPIALDTFRAIRRQQLEERARAAADVDIAHVLGRTSTNVPNPNAKPKTASGAATVFITPQSTRQQPEKILTVYTTASMWTGVSSRGVVVFRLPPNEAASAIEVWERDGWRIVYISLGCACDNKADKEDFIEVDSTPDGTYRVWVDSQNLGTFHRCPQGGWLVHPAHADKPRYCKTCQSEQQAIVRADRRLP